MFDRQKTNTEPRWLGPSATTRTPLIPSISAARWLLVLVAAAGVYFFYGFAGAGACRPRHRLCELAALPASWSRRVGGNTTIGATIAIILIVTFLVIPIEPRGYLYDR